MRLFCYVALLAMVYACSDDTASRRTADMLPTSSDGGLTDAILADDAGETHTRTDGFIDDMGPAVEFEPVVRVSGAIGPAPADQVDGFREPGFAADLVTGWSLLHVDSAAAAGGDGSRDRPFKAIQPAVEAAAGTPTVILIAPGEYAGPVELSGSVALLGAGYERTRIVGEDSFSVQVSGGDADRAIIGWLSIDGQNGLSATGIQELHLLHIQIRAGLGLGLSIDGVNTAACLNGSIAGAGLDGDVSENPLVRMSASGVALLKTRVEQHHGPGLIAGFGDGANCVRAPYALLEFCVS